MTPPIPQRKPERLNNDLLNKGADLFGSLFSGSGVAGIPSLSGGDPSSSAGGIYGSSITFGNDFAVGRNAGNPALNGTSIILLALVAGGIYLAGRK